MADISDFVHKFRASPRDDIKLDSTIKIHKRNRPVISCLSCRTRKSRCDREHPTCGTCSGKGTTCIYQANTKSVAKSNHQDRLARLETLVLQLMHSQDTSNSSGSRTVERPPPVVDSNATTGSRTQTESGIDASQGSFTNGAHGPSYVGPTHWEAVFDAIHGLKSESGSPQDIYTDQSWSDDTRESIFTTPKPTDLSFVAQMLPERSIVDSLTSIYINAKMFCMPIIHSVAFQRTYEKFWRDHKSVSILWISQLFSMLAIGSLLSQTAEGSELGVHNNLPPRNLFFRAAARCLVLANWERPQPLVVEAMFFYIIAKVSVGATPLSDGDEVFALFGAMVRQAYRLGYHREPSQIPGISVFDAEMRRRAWHIICQFDVIGCLQMGLPCNIQDTSTADIMKPRNLLDTDFDEDCLTLPPSRDETEITGMVYFIAKGELMEILKELLHRQLSKKKLLYDEDVMELDQKLRHAYLTMPQILRVKSISESYGTPPWLIHNRIKVDITYQKALCVLHRQHLDHNPRHISSLKACVHASMEILQHQRTLHSESVLGKRLTGDRWLATSMHLPDFFLGAMVLGFILCNFEAAELGGPDKVEDMKAMMQSALVINLGLRNVFRDSVRFSAAIEMILRKVQGPQLPDIELDLQSFTGPSMDTISDSTSPEDFGANLQDFGGYFDDTNSIDWTFMDAGLMMPPDSAKQDFDWTDLTMDTCAD